jgi:hypothetical protein
MKSGIELISEERSEQINKHGFTQDHDLHVEVNGGLVDAAIYLMMNYSGYSDNSRFFPEKWEESWRNKFDEKGDIDSLKVAGALIAAEIDRLQHNKYLLIHED